MATYTGHVRTKENGVCSFLIRTKKPVAKFIEDLNAANEGVEIIWMVECPSINMQDPVQ
jgi:hypothetical protein